MIRIVVSLVILFSVSMGQAQESKEPSFPPGWVPIHRLGDEPTWADFRKIDDKVHLYLPKDAKVVRGIFVCYVFHSGDPRELARLWNFALVTVPWPFEYDLGVNDKRNGRFKLGHPAGDMGVLLRYLDVAAKQTKHPELAVAPMVGWLGQSGSHLCADLFKRAPDRIIGWTDSFGDRLSKYPELTAKVPFAYAWEFTAKDGKDRAAERESKLPKLKDMLTPPSDLACRANTYGFPHGIYSKWNFFMLFLHRLIVLRLPEETPPPGQPTKLRPITKEMGWVGDYNPVGEWNPIAPSAKAKGMVAPTWLPDEYAAWGWRAYHSANPDVKLTSPIVEYRSKGADRRDCGLGYGNVMKAGTPLKFAAETKGEYAQIEFHDGDKIVGVAEKAPWQTDDVRLDRGLHALFAVGVTPSGERKASRAAFLVVE
ncbi:MAG: hypothetical protein K2X38_23720 [Gemmataceae bacterium]|nr:hypothetical protein [Gemmataceae bacterium]